MNNSKWLVVSLSTLSMFENALTTCVNGFEMDLLCISVPLKNIANISKRNESALQCVFNALKMHCNEKMLQRHRH